MKDVLMSKQSVCCDCQTRMALFPLEDQGYSITIDGKEAPICRECVKDMVIDQIKGFGTPDFPRDKSMGGVILEAFSEVVPIQ